MGEPAPRRKVTYDDVRSAPEHMIAEIIDGELYTSPRPGPRHAQSSSALGSVIHAAYGGRGNGGGPGQPGGWWILDEPELHLGEDVLVPDVAGWRRERMPHLPADAFFSLASDWACEVVSPSSSQLDRSALEASGYKIEDVARVLRQHPAIQFVFTGADLAPGVVSGR